jgi:hypothetical protein
MASNNSHHTYWHLSAVESREGILKHGLNPGEDGFIYLLDTLFEYFPMFKARTFLPDIIALNQVGETKYDLFSINIESAQTKLLEKDNVAEFSANNQWRIKTNNIPPNQLEFIETREVDIIRFLYYQEFCFNVKILKKYKFDKSLKTIYDPEYYDESLVPQEIKENVKTKLTSNKHFKHLAKEIDLNS